MLALPAAAKQWNFFFFFFERLQWCNYSLLMFLCGPIISHISMLQKFCKISFPSRFCEYARTKHTVSVVVRLGHYYRLEQQLHEQQIWRYLCPPHTSCGFCGV